MNISWRKRVWTLHCAAVGPRLGTDDDIHFTALALGGEVGELLNLIKKEWRHSYLNLTVRFDYADHKRKLIDEMADVQAYLYLLAMMHGVDLEIAGLEKALDVEKRPQHQTPEIIEALRRLDEADTD